MNLNDAIDRCFIRLYNTRVNLAAGMITKDEARLQLLIITADMQAITTDMQKG